MIKVIGFQRMKKCNEGGGKEDKTSFKTSLRLQKGNDKGGEGGGRGEEERTNKFNLNLNQLYFKK